MNLQAIPSLLSGLVALALGGFVWSRGPRRVGNWAFAWAMAGLGVMEFAHMMILRLAPAERAPWSEVALGAEALMLPGWALFSVAFARQDPAAELRRWRWPITAIGSLALTALAVSTLRPFALLRDPTQVDLLALTGYGKSWGIFALLTTVFVLFQLESTLRNSRGTARWQIKYLVVGVSGILGFHIFVLSDMLLANALHPHYLPAQSTAALLGFGLIGFGLVRHRLLEVNVFVSRHVVYRSLTVGAVGAYLIAMGIAGWVMRHLDITLDLFLLSLVIFVTAMGLMIVLLSESIRVRVKRAVAQHFYRHKYDYRREWTALTEKLASVVTPEAIPSRIVAMVVEAMGIRRAALFLAEEGGGYRLVDSVGGLRAGELTIDSRSPLVSRLVAEGKPLALNQSGPDDPLADEVAPLQDKGFTLLVPLVSKEEVLGLLAVGPPAGASTTQEDEELLATVAAQGATALLNARLAEQLAQARELEALNRVSSFILHDLKNCVSVLSLVTANAETVGEDPLFQRDAFRSVAESVRKMRELIDRLSHLPKSLELRLAPMDLNGLVREAVDRARLAVNGGIRVSAELDPLPPITADEEQVRKILDNLLLNAVEALPGEGEVRVRTATGNGSVSLQIADNGPGIPETILQGGLFIPFRTTKPKGLGIGLFQVKSIVEAHGGHIHVVSQKAKGTTIRVEFPLKSKE
jgi:hypothetical protein